MPKLISKMVKLLGKGQKRDDRRRRRRKRKKKKSGKI